MNDNPPRGPDDPGGRRQRAKRLADQLRRMYDGVANEGAPDEFLSLLNEADRKSGQSREDAHGESGKSDDDFRNLLDEADKSSKKD